MLVLPQMQSASMTIIEIRPARSGWNCFEASDVESIFLEQKDYAVLEIHSVMKLEVVK